VAKQAGITLGILLTAAACGGRTPTDIDTFAGGTASSGAGAGASASSGASAGAGSGAGASSNAGAGAGGVGGEGSSSGEGSESRDNGVVDAGFYVRYDAGPALLQDSYPQASGTPEQPVAIQCLGSLSLPLGPNGLPNCDVVVERPLGTTTLAECQKCDDVPGLIPFVPSVPLNELGEGLTSGSCLCVVTPLAKQASCPNLDETIATWCYASSTQAPGGPCGSSNRLAFSPLVNESGHVYVACFPLPSP
jgi:hypothetical protein